MDRQILKDIKNTINMILVKDASDFKGIKKLLAKKKQLKTYSLLDEYLKDQQNKLTKFALIDFDDELFEHIDNLRPSFNNIKISRHAEKKEKHIACVKEILNNNELLERLLQNNHPIFKSFKELLGNQFDTIDAGMNNLKIVDN
jgi:hypothetical protein